MMFNQVEPLLPSVRSLAIFNQFFSHFLVVLSSEFDANPQLSEEILTDRVLSEVLHNSTILIQVTEDVIMNSSIGFFSVTDLDNTSDPLHFDLRGDEETEKNFHLNSSSGSLSVKDRLDPDLIYSFAVLVEDEDGLSSETDVAVKVVRMKCQRPVFNQSSYEVDLVEGSYDHTSLINVEARDGDCGKGAR